MSEKKIEKVIEVDGHELACRILEAEIGAKIREGKTAQQALEEIDQHTRDGLYRAAVAATEYVVECLKSGKRIQ